MKRILTIVTALLASAAPVYAHAMLEHSSPGAGATIAHSPIVVTLEYSEALEPTFSQAAVTDSAGHDVASGPSTVSGTTMRVPLKALGPGAYHVIWHAVSVDTHRTEGAYGFTVKP